MECEKMRRMGDHRIRTRVNRSKWRSSSVPGNKDMRSLEKGRRKILRWRGGKRKVVMDWLRKSWSRWRERINNLRGRQYSKLSGESERSTV